MTIFTEIWIAKAFLAISGVILGFIGGSLLILPRILSDDTLFYYYTGGFGIDFNSDADFELSKLRRFMRIYSVSMSLVLHIMGFHLIIRLNNYLCSEHSDCLPDSVAVIAAIILMMIITGSFYIRYSTPRNISSSIEFFIAKSIYPLDSTPSKAHVKNAVNFSGSLFSIIGIVCSLAAVTLNTL